MYCIVGKTSPTNIVIIVMTRPVGLCEVQKQTALRDNFF